MQNLEDIIHKELVPIVKKIDNYGYYPEFLMKSLGKIGIYNLKNTKEPITKAIKAIASISKVCGTSGFCVWCQEVLSWYLLNTSNTNLRDNIADLIFNGKILGGTGLSNPVKSYANIEKNYLKATKVDNGYIINGTLPWVSNIEYGHVFGAIALRENGLGIMGLIKCDSDKLVLKDNIKFSALDGSATKSIVLKDYCLNECDIIAQPAEAFVAKIAPGFILLQTGMAIGIIRACIVEMENANTKHKNINDFLDIKISDIELELNRLYETTLELAKNPYQNDNKEYMIKLLETRLQLSELTLKASKAACLYNGAIGYIKNSNCSRILRESYFIALITPSIKHLKKELHDISNGNGIMKYLMNV